MLKFPLPLFHTETVHSFSFLPRKLVVSIRRLLFAVASVSQAFRLTHTELTIKLSVHVPFIRHWMFKATKSFFVGMATRYGLDGPEIESSCGEYFSAHPGQSLDPRNLLYE